VIIEGVTYYRFRVTFRLADGRRRRWVRWSPGPPWVRDEVGRELYERFGLSGVRERSCSITEA
jgi:hypothetical protein